MNHSIQQLVQLAENIGEDIRLVQGGGGNISIKSENLQDMWIKASGLRISDIGPSSGYVELPVEKVKNIINNKYLKNSPPLESQEKSTLMLLQCVRSQNSLRPSLETLFHAFLSKVVIHVHAISTNVWTCLTGGKEKVLHWLDEPFVWVNYAAPGYWLGLEVYKEISSYQEKNQTVPPVIFLENHGIIFHGENLKKTVSHMNLILKKAELAIGQGPIEVKQNTMEDSIVSYSKSLQKVFHKHGYQCAVRPAKYSYLDASAIEKVQQKKGMALVPDDVVYGVHKIHFIKDFQSPMKGILEIEKPWPSKMVLHVETLGFLLVAPNEKLTQAMEENLFSNLMIQKYSQYHGVPQEISKVDIDFLMNMESEKYRQNVASCS